MAWFSLAHLRRPERATARDLFLASLAYLPVVLAAIALDRGPVSGTAGARGGRTTVQEAR
jgi:heme O synthase-like polyprenyltransferase